MREMLKAPHASSAFWVDLEEVREVDFDHLTLLQGRLTCGASLLFSRCQLTVFILKTLA